MVLRPGDVLYIPRGVAHWCNTDSEVWCHPDDNKPYMHMDIHGSYTCMRIYYDRRRSPKASLHLTLTMPTSDWSWGVLLSNAVDQANPKPHPEVGTRTQYRWPALPS